MEIKKVQISELTSNFTGVTSYYANVFIGLKTTAELDLESFVYGNPSLNLSLNDGQSALVFYSKIPLKEEDLSILTGDYNPAEESRRKVLLKNAIVETRSLSRNIRDVNGELSKDLFMDYKFAMEIKERYRKGNFSDFSTDLETSEPIFPIEANIEYIYSFGKNLNSLYEDAESSDDRDLYVYVKRVRSRGGKTRSLGASRGIQVLENDIVQGNKNEDLREDFYENLFQFNVFEYKKSPSLSPLYESLLLPGSIIKIKKSEETKQKSMTSDLFLSYGKKSQVKAMFAIDKMNILRNKSDFSGLLSNQGIKNSGDEKAKIANNSLFLDLKIKRQKIKKLLGFEARTEKNTQNFVPTTVASSRENPDNNELIAVDNFDSRNLKGQISQLPIDLGQDGISFIGFNDFDTSQEGIYQYSLQSSMKDGIRKYISDLISNVIDDNGLLEIISRLENYYGSFYVNGEDPAGFGPTMQDDASRIAEIVKVLNDDAYNLGDEFNNSLKRMTNFQGSLLNLIKFTTELAQKLQNLQTISSNQIFLAKSKNTSKLNTDRSVIFYNTDFNEYVDLTELKNINYDYAGIKENIQVGTSIISTYDARRRFDFEFYTKLVKSSRNDVNSLNEEIYGDTFGSEIPEGNTSFDMSQTYYSYLSPVKIRDTFLTSQNMFDSDSYTSLHYKELENNNTTNKVLLYEIMSNFGISISNRFYKSVGDGSIVNALGGVLSPKLKSFDGKLDDRENYVPFVNSMLQREEGWSVTKQDYTNDKISEKIKDSTPNHARILFGGKSDACKNKWISTIGDYFKNPNTYYMMKQLFMNLILVESLSFGTDDEGNIDLKKDITTKMDLATAAEQGFIICKTSYYSNLPLNIGQGFGERNSTNKYFVITDLVDSAGLITSQIQTTEVLNTLEGLSNSEEFQT
tara:strand:- start:1001 stop:3736 length:2736 start_codon:yes stop_codon:yes gene_type:complete